MLFGLTHELLKGDKINQKPNNCQFTEATSVISHKPNVRVTLFKITSKLSTANHSKAMLQNENCMKAKF
jgi:hypothetical protein